MTLNLCLFRSSNASRLLQGPHGLLPSEWAVVLPVAAMRNTGREPLTGESPVTFSLSTLR